MITIKNTRKNDNVLRKVRLRRHSLCDIECHRYTLYNFINKISVKCICKRNHFLLHDVSRRNGKLKIQYMCFFERILSFNKHNQIIEVVIL